MLIAIMSSLNTRFVRTYGPEIRSKMMAKVTLVHHYKPKMVGIQHQRFLEAVVTSATVAGVAFLELDRV